MRAYELAASVPWAITEPMLRAIFEIAYRENPDPQAVAAQLGRPLENTRAVTMRDGVAVIPISGPIFRHANLFSEISGATTIEALALDLQQSLADPTVSAILLNVDSPGGEVNGVNEFTHAVHAARSVKPVWAYIGHLGASAAYWIASAAERVLVEESAIVGSIGVYAALPDPRATTAKEIEFVSSQSPRKRPDPTTDSGKQQIQDEIDAIADVFVATVARNRGVTTETVLADYGQGGVFVGQAAISSGLADELGSFEGAIRALTQHVAGSSPTIRRAAFAGYAPTIARALAQEASMPIQWKEVFGGMFKAAEDHEAEQGTLLEGTVEQTERQPQPGVQLSAGLPPATYLPPTAPQESAEVAALKQQIAEERNARITAQADSFAEGMIASGHALPHEREHMTRLFRHAAEDDMDRPLAQSTTGAQASEGTPAPATRVGMLRASFEDRTPHGLTAETLPATTKLGVVSTPTTTAQMQGEQPLSEERRQKLLGSTPLGETILNGRHN